MCVCVCVCVWKKRISTIWKAPEKSLSHRGSRRRLIFPAAFQRERLKLRNGCLYFLEPTEVSQGQGRPFKATPPPAPAIISTPSKFIFLCCESREATWYLMVPCYPIHCHVGCYLWFPGWPCQMKARWQLSLLEDITEGPQEGLPDNYAFAKVSSTSSNFPAKAPPWDKKTVQISRSCVRTECFGHSTI